MFELSKEEIDQILEVAMVIDEYHPGYLDMVNRIYSRNLDRLERELRCVTLVD